MNREKKILKENQRKALETFFAKKFQRELKIKALQTKRTIKLVGIGIGVTQIMSWGFYLWYYFELDVDVWNPQVSHYIRKRLGPEKDQDHNN